MKNRIDNLIGDWKWENSRYELKSLSENVLSLIYPTNFNDYLLFSFPDFNTPFASLEDAKSAALYNLLQSGYQLNPNLNCMK